MGVWVILHISKWDLTYPIAVYDERDKVKAILSYLEYLRASTSRYDRELLNDIRKVFEHKTGKRYSRTNNIELAKDIENENDASLFDERGDYEPDAGYPHLVYLDDNEVNDVSVWEYWDNWNDKDLLRLIKTLMRGIRGDLWR